AGGRRDLSEPAFTPLIEVALSTRNGRPRGKRPFQKSCLRSRLRCVDVRRQGLLGRLDEGDEGRRLVDRELGEHAAVNLNACKTETLDEAVVRDAVLASSGVDALDPEATEVALALATVTVCVNQRVGDLLLGLAVEAR